MAIFKKISDQEKVDLVHNLSLLIKSGAPINTAFSLLSKQTKNHWLKKTLLAGKLKTEQGTSIHQVFAEDKNFDNVFVSFIRAGEESGTLEKNLEYLGDWMDRKNNLQKALKAATLYPKIIIGFAVILGAVLSVFVLPQLVPIFSILEVDLPFTTRILLFASDLMRNYGTMVILGILIFVVIMFFLLRLKKVRNLVDVLVLKIPVFGSLYREYQLTIISQLSSILLTQSGLTLRHAFEIVSDSVSNSLYRKSIKAATERIIRGTNVSEALKKYPKLYPEIFTNVVSTGEATGSLGQSLDYLADFFADRVAEKMKKLPVVLEPVLLIVIGLFVAFIASAIIMPIYEVTKGLY